MRTVLLLLLVLSACAWRGTPADADAAAFWREFREAALADDIGRVMRLTKFPFPTTGELDDDPVAKHGRAAFPALFARLLRQHERPSPGASIPMRELIRRTTVLGEANFNGEDEHFHVGALYFGKEGGRWLLLEAYLAE